MKIKQIKIFAIILLSLFIIGCQSDKVIVEEPAELLKINSELKELIHNKSDEKKIYKVAFENGFKKMIDNANDLIEKKIISKQ